MRRLACLIALVLLAQACGIKGPLYIETPEQRRKAEERRERREAAKQRDAQQGAAAASGTIRTTPQPAPTASDAETEPSESPDLTIGDDPFGPSAPPQ